MVRWIPLVFVASSIACGPDHESPTGSDAASESTTVAATSTSADSSSSSTTANTAPDLDTTDSGTSGNPGVDCPPASPDIGAVTHVVRAETWTFADDFGISEGICSATDYDGEQLLLECTRVGQQVRLGGVARDGLTMIADSFAGFLGRVALDWEKFVEGSDPSWQYLSG